MKKNILLAVLLFSTFFLFSQEYDDYIGAGHSEGISVMTSNDFQKSGRIQEAKGENTLKLNGLDGKMVETARFLTQTTFGANWENITDVTQIDFEDWMDDQFAKTPTLILPEMIEAYQLGFEIFINNGGNPNDYTNRPDGSHFDYAWWHVNMTNEDQLRHKVALALSEILVVSINSSLDNWGEGLGDYYDVLVKNAFGNYLDILTEVSFHPSMGVYLSHLNNPKSDPDKNIHPDENYAREVMQLFSIGLYELELDGSRKLDTEGDFIPTYNQNDVKEFAKVFTGLGAGGSIAKNDDIPPRFGLGLGITDFTVPMVMYSDMHEPGEKHLLNGYIIPDDQDAMLDINQTIEHLFNHPNVGPFIGRKLIQRLIKSNPSPAYISSVSAAFNDNGKGVRGDMKAVIKAIFLNDEARTCEWMNDEFQGRLREPITRYTQFAKAIGARNNIGLYWNDGSTFYDNTGQHPLNSPSVFNFYSPDFQPNGSIASNDLVAPEFQIHNARTSIGYANQVNEWTVEENLFKVNEDNAYNTKTDYSQLLEFAKDPDVIINKLDVLLTSGQLSDDTRAIIKEAISGFSDNSVGDYSRLKLAVYLIMISPDYNIFR